MKQFHGLVLKVILLFVVIVIGMRLIFSKASIWETASYDAVDLNRIKQEINEYETKEGRAPKNLSELCSTLHVSYDSIDEITVYFYGDKAMDEKLRESGNRYELYPGTYGYYYIQYSPTYGTTKKPVYLFYVVILVMFVLTMGVLLYMRQKLIKPFSQFSELPYELSKGNLTIPIKESKSKYFGRFLWGMDMLRASIEESKKRELAIERDQKLLLLSLSHDIKTPLSAIKLYGKSISKDLYKSEEKKQRVADGINEKVDEIEAYISEIVRSSNEDFLNFQVENTEFYAKDLFTKIDSYYKDKMELAKIDFSIEPYRNILLKGDVERGVEVLQNIIENAVKYGDGKRIFLRTSREENMYVIEVRNTGCTLESRELIHIMDSFYRGSNVKNQEGSGLGLQICRKLMNLMEGEISVAIEEEDKERLMCVTVCFQLA